MKVYVVQRGEFNYGSEIICICSNLGTALIIVRDRIVGTGYKLRQEWQWVYGMDYYEIIEYTIDECSSDNDNV